MRPATHFERLVEIDISIHKYTQFEFFSDAVWKLHILPIDLLRNYAVSLDHRPCPKLHREENIYTGENF